jgi:hypothetical protein
VVMCSLESQLMHPTAARSYAGAVPVELQVPSADKAHHARAQMRTSLASVVRVARGSSGHEVPAKLSVLRTKALGAKHIGDAEDLCRGWRRRRQSVPIRKCMASAPSSQSVRGIRLAQHPFPSAIREPLQVPGARWLPAAGAPPRSSREGTVMESRRTPAAGGSDIRGSDGRG